MTCLQVDCVKLSVGFELDEQLSFDNQIDSLSKKISKRTRILNRIKVARLDFLGGIPPKFEQ